LSGGSVIEDKKHNTNNMIENARENSNIINVSVKISQNDFFSADVTNQFFKKNYREKI